MELISVLMPTYNRAHMIGKAIKSLLEQTYSNLQIVIVDDGSTDNT
jgi:glycosyltransferase involved in cell wall biosynthesis